MRSREVTPIRQRTDEGQRIAVDGVSDRVDDVARPGIQESLFTSDSELVLVLPFRREVGPDDEIEFEITRCPPAMAVCQLWGLEVHVPIAKVAALSEEVEHLPWLGGHEEPEHGPVPCTGGAGEVRREALTQRQASWVETIHGRPIHDLTPVDRPAGNDLVATHAPERHNCLQAAIGIQVRQVAALHALTLRVAGVSTMRRRPRHPGSVRPSPRTRMQSQRSFATLCITFPRGCWGR